MNWPEIIAALNEGKDRELETTAIIGTQSRWLRVKISGVYDQTGKLNGKLILIEDVSAIHSARLGLQEVQSRLADIIDFLPDGTFVLDKKSHVIIWNKAMENLTGV